MWLLETCKAHMWLVCVAGSEFQFERPVWSLEWERGPSAALPVWTLPSPVSAAATSIQVRQTAGSFRLSLSPRSGPGLGANNGTWEQRFGWSRGGGAWPGWGDAALLIMRPIRLAE